MARWFQKDGKIYRVKDVRTYKAGRQRPEDYTSTTYYGPYSSLPGARSYAGKLRNTVWADSTAVVTIEYTEPDWKAV